MCGRFCRAGEKKKLRAFILYQLGTGIVLNQLPLDPPKYLGYVSRSHTTPKVSNPPLHFGHRLCIYAVNKPRAALNETDKVHTRAFA